jgi:hypothetical protein
MSRHSVFFELMDALGQPGCALCRLATESVLQYFGSLGYEQVTDVELRDELRAGGGFCARHAWLFHEASGNRLGVAIIYRDLLHHALVGLKAGRQVGGGLGRRLAGLLAGGRAAEPAGRQRAHRCSACRFEAEAEERFRSTLLEHLAEADVRRRYAESAGLCLPHLARGLESGGRAEDLAWLRQDAAERLGAIVAELDEYIRKHDYRFRKEGWGEERDAPRRAVERAVGRPIRPEKALHSER